jgi:hypothetical protein
VSTDQDREPWRLRQPDHLDGEEYGRGFLDGAVSILKVVLRDIRDRGPEGIEGRLLDVLCQVEEQWGE